MPTRMWFTNAEETKGTMQWMEGTKQKSYSGLIPPPPEFRGIYDDLIAQGVTVEPYSAPSTAYTDRQELLRADPRRIDLLDKLKNASIAQIDTYVDNNVTNIADARLMFKRILLLIA